MVSQKTILLLTIALLVIASLDASDAAPVSAKPSLSAISRRQAGSLTKKQIVTLSKRQLQAMILAKRGDDDDDDDSDSDDDDDDDDDSDSDDDDDNNHHHQRIKLVRISKPFPVSKPFPIPEAAPVPAPVPVPLGSGFGGFVEPFGSAGAGPF
ncbi:hypothetical protein FBU30_005848 [Linnemannia zychae]|nr:hypothetical protein FBU30_005848 [Linnemannia zychae]